VYCCVNCFSNSHIIEKILSYNETDDCEYCHSENIAVAEVSEIGDYIRECLSKAYNNATTDDIPYWMLKGDATTIDEVLRWDEAIFSANMEDQNIAEQLLRDLMSESGPSWHDIAQGDYDYYEGGDAEIVLVDAFYGPDHNRYQLSWEEFTYTVKHINRFFDVVSNRTREQMLSEFDLFFKLMEKELPTGYRIWRGRRDPDQPYITPAQQTKECGPPPRHKATPLRMNPAGISYFYGAEDRLTSAEEIRAREGIVAIFGLFENTRTLRIVDLSDIPFVPIDSIFSPGYNHEMNWAGHFLRSFRNEISKPVQTSDAHIEYIPTQILCEYIRKQGYDGIRYLSSLTEGFNLTLFCGPSELDNDDTWMLKHLQIPTYTDWLILVDFVDEVQ
jgi:hypothetical protein